MIPNRSIAVLASAMLFSLGSLVLDGCGPSEKERLRAEGEDPEGRHIVPVEVARAERKTLAVTNSYSGTLEGEEQANIVAKVSERITAIHVRVGQAVRAGEVMISLDKSGASSQYYQAEANFKNAEKTLARMKSLYAEGAISLQTLDGVQTAFDVAEANFASARIARATCARAWNRV